MLSNGALLAVVLCDRPSLTFLYVRSPAEGDLIGADVCGEHSGDSRTRISRTPYIFLYRAAAMAGVPFDRKKARSSSANLRIWRTTRRSRKLTSRSEECACSPSISGTGLKLSVGGAFGHVFARRQPTLCRVSAPSTARLVMIAAAFQYDLAAGDYGVPLYRYMDRMGLKKASWQAPRIHRDVRAAVHVDAERVFSTVFRKVSRRGDVSTGHALGGGSQRHPAAQPSGVT